MAFLQYACVNALHGQFEFEIVSSNLRMYTEMIKTMFYTIKLMNLI